MHAPTINAGNDLALMGDASNGAVTSAHEDMLGRAWSRQLRAQVPQMDDPLLTEFIEYTLNRLVRQSLRPQQSFNILTIRNDRLNAFAAPGGIVGVNAGLFLHARRESEFASVLAHELAHLDQRHFGRQMAQAKLDRIPNMLKILGGIAVASAMGGEAGSAAMIAAQGSIAQNQLKYSRNFEKEADRIGLRLLTDAGYDPTGMADMFNYMNRMTRFGRRPPEYLLTHPNSGSRESDVSARLTTEAATDFRPDNPDYNLLRIRVNLAFKGHSLSLLQGYNERIRTASGNNLSARYAQALLTAHTGNPDEGIRLLQSLVDSYPDSKVLNVSLVELMSIGKRNSEALALVLQLRKKFPDSLSLDWWHAQVLYKQGRYGQSADILERMLISRPEDASIWYQMAETQGKAGNIAKLHRARAEFYLRTGRYKRSLRQIEIGLRQTGAKDPVTAAILRQREADIKKEVKNLKPIIGEI